MLINEAIAMARVEQKAIRRKKWEGLGMLLLPTNSNSLRIVIFSEHEKKGTRFWNPSAEDLVADDWEVY